MSTSEINGATPHRMTPPDIGLRAILKLATPIFIANLSIMGAGTIDTVMAGRLGAEHLAAVRLRAPPPS